jgi:hypothetical protein
MTKEEITSLTTDRELDSIVNAMVFKRNTIWNAEAEDWINETSGKKVPAFSRDLTIAWEIVEWLHSQGKIFYLTVLPSGKVGAYFATADMKTKYEFGLGTTASEAICKASLLTLL